jgi:hypothetical protein
MPQIIVVADRRSDRTQGRDAPVTFTERVSVQDFESQHFQGQLVERLGWAVGDADAVERGHTADDWDDAPRPEHRNEVRRPAEASPAESDAWRVERPRRGRLSVVGPVS